MSFWLHSRYYLTGLVVATCYLCPSVLQSYSIISIQKVKICFESLMSVEYLDECKGRKYPCVPYKEDGSLSTRHILSVVFFQIKTRQ
jgi:alkyl hydroperoxide reductase subunit AhpF